MRAWLRRSDGCVFLGIRRMLKIAWAWVCGGRGSGGLGVDKSARYHCVTAVLAWLGGRAGQRKGQTCIGVKILKVATTEFALRQRTS